MRPLTQSLWWRQVMFCAALILCLHAFNASAADSKTVWKAGAASVVITPPTNMWMAGYAARTKPSEGKAQDLFAKALALEDTEGKRFVFITTDLIGVPRVLRQGLEKRLLTAYKVPGNQLLLNASHTHSGPEFRVGKTPGDDGEFKPTMQGEEYGRMLEEKLFQLVGEAIQELAPAKLAYQHARCGFAMNRRLPGANGVYRNAPNPDGVVDHDVPVLRVTNPEGKLRAVLFSYACHNTTLSFYQFCGDYAGFAQEYLQTDNPGVIALFMTGCAGDQNPYPRGTLDQAKQHGRSLATAVEAALTTTPRELTGTLRAAYAEFELPYAPAREEFTARLASKDKYEAGHAQRMLAKLDKGELLPKSYPYPVQAVRLGNELTMIALGGEVVVDYSLRLKREWSGPGALWVSAYCNDVMGYIPSERVLKEGGYEAGGAMLFSLIHPGPWASGTEEKIIQQVKALQTAVK